MSSSFPVIEGIEEDQGGVGFHEAKHDCTPEMRGILLQAGNEDRDPKSDSDDDDEFLLNYDPFCEMRSKTNMKFAEEACISDEELNLEYMSYMSTRRSKLLKKLDFKSPLELHKSVQQALSWYHEVFDVLMMPDRDYQLRFKNDEDDHDDLVLRSPLKKKVRSTP